MHHLLKFSLLIVILMNISFAKDPTRVTNTQCSTYEQNTTKSDIWRCPDIDTALYQELGDIDLSNGNYVCSYRYKDTGAIANSCNYNSSYYNNIAKHLPDKIAKKVNNYDEIDFQKDFNYVESEYESKYVQDLSSLEELVNSTISKLKDYFDEAQDNKDKGQLAIDKDLQKINQIIKTHLIYPYIKNDPSLPQKDVNFASFVAGLVTLDPDIVKGYNPNTGKLEISNKFKTKATDIAKDGKLGKELVDIRNINSNLSNYATTDEPNISSWIDIFEMKLWGWYYQFQSYFDIGYDVLSTQLLFLTMAFFAMGASVRGGVRYISNREMGNSSGEIKMGEEQLVKTLGVLAIIGFFFISIPSNQKDPNTGQEMRKNLTLAKQFIRFSVQEGSYYATMFTDLGSASFLDYIVKKQGLFTGLELKHRLSQSIIQLVQYYPSHQITRECASYYNTDFNNLISASDINELTANDNYNSNFFKNNNIKGINFNLCIKSAKNILIIPHDVAYNLYETDSISKNANDYLSSATNNIIKNHIALEDRLGWYSVGAIPFTYFMMKKYDMFATKPIDYDEIEKKAKTLVTNIGLKNSDSIRKHSVYEDLFSEKTVASIKNFAGKWIARGTSYIAQVGFYNMLPGFSSIRESINKYLNNTYRDMLEVDKKDDDGLKNMISNVIGGITKISPIGWVAKLISKTKELVMTSPVLAHTIFIMISYAVAIGIWKMGFSILFISSIITLILFKIVIYGIMVLKHFTISLFVVAWAFASGNNGLIKSKNFIRETIIISIYPSIVVLGVFVFIFSYELFQTIYMFVINILIEGQFKIVDIAGHTLASVDNTLAYFTLHSLRYMTEIIIDIFSFVLALATIQKFPENVLKMMGLQDSTTIDMSRQAHETSQKGDKHVNPLS